MTPVDGFRVKPSAIFCRRLFVEKTALDGSTPMVETSSRRVEVEVEKRCEKSISFLLALANTSATVSDLPAATGALVFLPSKAANMPMELCFGPNSGLGLGALLDSC